MCYIGSVLFQIYIQIDLDRSRFVRQDRSSPVKKNVQIFLLRPLLLVNKLRRRPAAQMGVAKSDFSQMRRSRSDLIKNAERFARIDLDRSRFEKERNNYHHSIVTDAVSILMILTSKSLSWAAGAEMKNDVIKLHWTMSRPSPRAVALPGSITLMWNGEPAHRRTDKSSSEE